MVLVSAVQKDNNKVLTVHSEALPEDMSWTDLDPDSIQSYGPTDELEIVIGKYVWQYGQSKGCRSEVY